MTALLVGPAFARARADRVREIARDAEVDLELVVLPDDPEGRVPAEDAARIELAYFGGGVYPDLARAFFAAALGASKLRWLHCFNTGLDHPIFARFLERGVTVTNSPGANAVPIAQTAIAGLLSLARLLPLFAEAQRARTWREMHDLAPPADLTDQTLVVVGVGRIGAEIARLARALGLYVIGVRRDVAAIRDLVDEAVGPEALDAVLPRADWLALACPLTDETRGLLGAARLACLPRGARLLNVARGEIVDEVALAEALAGGALGGAYLDVFAEEPLPPGSPLWSLPNVIVTPHASSISAGSVARQNAIFLDNLRRWAAGRPLANVVG